MRKPFHGLILVAVVFAAATTAIAGSWRVEQDGSGDFTTLQPAVDAAASGDTILVGPGWYQEMLWTTDVGGNDIQLFAYWRDLKDLVIIGTGEVTFGPSTYVPASYNPKGIFSEAANALEVHGISFCNLYTGILNGGFTVVEQCTFRTGEQGVYILHQGSTLVDCVFEDLENSAVFVECDTAIVSNCEFHNAKVYFGQTRYGVVRDCVVEGGGLVNYYQSGGLVVGNVAECDGTPCVDCSWSRIEISDNRFTGGMMNVSVIGAGALAEAHDNLFAYPEYWNFDIANYASFRAWNNDIYRTILGSSYVLKASYYSNPSDAYIDVRGNYWGPLDSREDILAARIWDGNDDPDLEILVDYVPLSAVPLPAMKKPLDGLKAMFR